MYRISKNFFSPIVDCHKSVRLSETHGGWHATLAIASTRAHGEKGAYEVIQPDATRIREREGQ